MTNVAEAIIVAYRSEDVIQECVKSLLADGAISKVWVVNNSPGDGSRREVSYLERVTYLESSGNIGFGRGVNSVRHLVRSPYVLLANPDTRQEEKTATALVSFLDCHPRAAVAAPRMVDANGRMYRNSKHAISLGRMIFESLGFRGRWGVTRTAKDHLAAHRAEYVIGSFMLCRREALDSVAWFDERIFLFGEDQDLCRRLRGAAWEVWYAALGQVAHSSGHSWRQLDDQGRRHFAAARRRELMAERGRLEAETYDRLIRVKDAVSGLGRKISRSPRLQKEGQPRRAMSTKTLPMEERRLKVVFIVGSFHDDDDQFETLSKRADVTVYGTRLRPNRFGRNGADHASPARAIRSREFEPLFRGKRGHLWWFYPGLGRALDDDDPDVVHVLSEPWGLLPLQASRWARRHPEVALVIHGCDRIWWHGSSLEQVLRRRLSLFTLGRTDAYAAESAKAIERAQEAGLPRSVHTAVVHTNPRSPVIFSPPKDDSDRASARLRLGLPPDGIAIGFIGNLIEKKGPLAFLNAVRDLGESSGEVWSAIAGRGVLEDRLRAAAQTSSTIFVGGLPFPEGVRDFFRSMNVICVPSETTPDSEEQSPRVVIEAMLSGCIVVASDSGATSEMIGDAGVVVREKSPGDLRAGMLKAIEAISGGTAISRRASERASALYSGTAVAEQLIQIWTQAVQRRRLRVG